MKTLWALHGFLGQASDWDFLEQELFEKNIQLEKVNLYEKPKPFPFWAKDFCQKVEKKGGENFLLGYSLGGRLALHVLFQNQELWKKAIIVSAHPGLKTTSEKKERRLTDNQWVEKIQSKDWESLMEEWNSQSVFKNRTKQSPQRLDEDFSREQLVKAMSLWSLSEQSSFWEELEFLETPTLWLTGEQDTKFSLLAEKIPAISPNLQKRQITGGHRLPWDNREAFVEAVLQWLD